MLGLFSFPSFHLVCIVRTSGPDGLVEGKRSYKKNFFFSKRMGETRTQSERLGGIDLRVRGDRSVVMRKETDRLTSLRTGLFSI